MCLAAVLLTAGAAQAVDRWFDDLTGDHLWKTPGNWSGGVVPTLADWGKIRNGIAVVDSGTNAVCLKIAIGYNANSTLTLDGGTITMPEDLTVGRSATGIFNMIRGTVNCRSLNVGYSPALLGTVNMARGTTINLTTDLKVPNLAASLAIMNMAGGTINAVDDLDMNDDTGNLANKLNLTAGTISVGDDLEMIAGGSKIDIKFGTLIIGDSGPTSSANIDGYISNGYITGFGIVGNVKKVVAGGDITLTANDDPLDRSPAMDAYVYINPTLPLSWTNQTGSTGVDVWFGKDPTWIPEPNQLLPGYPGHYVDFTKVVSNQNVTTVNVDASINLQEYAWRIDTYGPVAEPNGLMMYFKATSDSPVESVVIDTPSMVTWINKEIHLSATVTDDNESDPDIVWTSDEPNAVFTNKAYTYNAGTGKGTATADVTVNWHTAQFNVTVTVDDDSAAGEPVSDTVSHDCAESACQATRVLGYGVGYQADVDANCIINIADLQRLAMDWLKDYTLLAPSPIAP
jgi:hypothetical protein